MAFEIGFGEWIYFVGCIFHEIYTPMVRKLNRGKPAVIFTLGVLIASRLVLLIYGWGELRTVEWAALTGRVWFFGLSVGVCDGWELCFVAIRHAPAACRQGDGLYLSDADLGDLVGDRVWERRAAALGSVGVGLTVVALLLLLRNEEASRNCHVFALGEQNARRVR